MRRTTSILSALVLAGSWAAPAAAQPAEPEYPSPAWFEREARNYAKTQEEPQAQASSPEFLVRWREQTNTNNLTFTSRNYVEGTWPWDSRGNLCYTWAEQCTGEPFLYPGVDPFYEEEADVTEVAFYDLDGALLSGRVWAPKDHRGRPLPGVVIETGSVQAPETLYWWFAQTLVRNGYVVMTYDVRGQGRSDNESPDGSAGTNFNPDVFVTDLVAAVDFLLSTPQDPYTPNVEGDRVDSDLIVAHNPYWQVLDRDRTGIVGHSLGATGVSVVQGLDPWIGPSGDENPVDAAVAWDNLSAGTTSGSGASTITVGEVVPRVPTMGQSGDYYLTPTPYTSPPDPDEKRQGYLAWHEAGVPTFQVNIQGGTHYEWSYLPTFPSTSWGRPWSGDEGWGPPMAEHFSLAWLDRWLKRPGEPGYATADARLLDRDPWCERLSFYFTSSMSFPTRDGRHREVDDLRAACLGAATGDATGDGDDGGTAGEPAGGAPRPLPSTGGGASAIGLLLLLTTASWARASRRRRASPPAPRRRRAGARWSRRCARPLPRASARARPWG